MACPIVSKRRNSRLVRGKAVGRAGYASAGTGEAVTTLRSRSPRRVVVGPGRRSSRDAPAREVYGFLDRVRGGVR